MKKYLSLVIVSLLLIGCNEKKEEENILSTGKLECGIKEERQYNNSLYTSYYEFNYDDGILKEVIEYEELDLSRVKNKTDYIEDYKKTKEEFKDIKGVTVEDLSKDDIYSLKIIYDLKKMDKNVIEKYKFDLSRKEMYNLYTNSKYKCN